MTEQTPDPAAGASSMGGSGGGLVAVRRPIWPPACRTAADRRCPSPGFGRAARRAARPARVLAHHKGRRDRHHRDQRLRDRRHRRAGPRRAAAVLGSRPDAAARQHARRRRQPGRRVAVVPVVGRQHSHRPQRAHRARGAEGRRRGHLGGPGHARGAAHRGRRRPVVTADRRSAPAVAHRNRLAFRRTRRAHRGAVAAQRPDRPPRRARPEDAAAAACATSSCSTRWPSPNSPTSIRAGRWPRRPARWARRTWRCSTCAPNCTGCPAAAANCCWPSTPTRSAPRCASVTDSTWRACSPTPPAPSATTSTPGCAPRPTRCRAAGLPRSRRPVRRPLDEGVIEFAGEVILARDARPERDPGLILRVAAASAHHRAADGGVDAGPARRDRARAAHAVAAPGAQGPAGDAGRRARRRWPRSRRWTAPGLWGRLFPEWGAVRDLPPRDVVHIWTVDRHLVETVSRASAFTTRVSRPDLLVLGALCHDIGKGRGGDHSVIGAELATQIGTRLGLWPSDVEVLSKMVRHHLLLPHTATRRDLQDPKTIATVVDALDGDPRAARAAARAGRGRLAGHRSRCVGRLEGVADRRPGAALPAGDGGRAAAAARSH